MLALEPNIMYESNPLSCFVAKKWVHTLHKLAMAMLTEVQYHCLLVDSHPNGVEEKSLTFIATLN